MQCAHFRRALLQRFQLCSGLRLPPLTGAPAVLTTTSPLASPPAFFFFRGKESSQLGRTRALTRQAVPAPV